MAPPPAEALPAASAVDHRLILIGDAGDPDPDGEPTLHALRKYVERIPQRTTVVFLGDNVYETGMPEPTEIEGRPVEEILDETLLNLFASRRDAERRVKAQVKGVDVRGARAIFVPGNHDWDQFGIGGWKRVRELERYVEQLAKTTDVRLSLLPGGGCPGPITRDLGRHGRLIVLDTQWTPVGHDGASLFAHSDRERPGLMQVDFLHDGRVRLAVIEAAPGTPDGAEAWAQLLETTAR